MEFICYYRGFVIISDDSNKVIIQNGETRENLKEKYMKGCVTEKQRRCKAICDSLLVTPVVPRVVRADGIDIFRQILNNNVNILGQKID